MIQDLIDEAMNLVAGLLVILVAGLVFFYVASWLVWGAAQVLPLLPWPPQPMSAA